MIDLNIWEIGFLNLEWYDSIFQLIITPKHGLKRWHRFIDRIVSLIWIINSELVMYVTCFIFVLV